MQQVTIGPKYQIVIPKEIRKKINGLKPGAKVNLSEHNGNKITLEPVHKTWAERTLGIAKEAWKDIDTTAELQKMKDEWEEKLAEQAKIWNHKNAAK